MLEALLDVGRRRFVAGGADAAAVAGVVGQPGDVGGVAVLGAELGGDRRGVGPAGDVDIGLAGLALVAVRREGELLAVRREHREAVETGEEGDPLEIAAVGVDRPDVELPALGVAVVGREEDPLAVGEEEGRERGGAEVGHLAGVPGALEGHVGHPDLELARAHEVLRQELLVVLEVGPGRTRGAIDDLLAVAGEEGAAVVARAVGETHHVLAVGVHPVELEVAVAGRGEDDRAVDRADRRLGVVGLVPGELLQRAALDVAGEELVGAVDRPDIALRAVGRRRAIGGREMGRRRRGSAGCRDRSRRRSSCPCRSRAATGPLPSAGSEKIWSQA